MGTVQVGEFPGLERSRRGSKMIRSIPNPLDKATIVSILPLRIEENKHTVFPGTFIIEPGSLEKPAILVVGPSSWFRESPNLGAPMDEFPNSAVAMAESVVRDYCNGLLGCDMENKRPGLFFIPGEVSLKDVTMKYASSLSEANVKQMNWFTELVKLADSLWARSNGNPMVIWDMMRVAAKALNLNDKLWLQNFQSVAKINCIGCGGLKDPAYPICPNCKLIDANHPLAKELSFAK